MFHFSKSPNYYLYPPFNWWSGIFCVLTAILTLLPISQSNAQQANDRKASIGRPEPEAMRVQVIKGQTVRITLSCTTKSKAALVEYLIRDFPTHGIVGSLLPTPEDRTKATIIYQSAKQSKGKVDMFSFYARYAGGNYSAPARVIIDLADPEANIESPVSIDFGNLILGGQAVHEILLKNTGNIEFQKHIQFPAPLELLDPADGKLSIPPGGNMMLKIRYQPEKIGTFNSNFVFQDKPGTTFIGNALAPFSTSTEELTLLWNERKQNRQGELKITNQSNTPISIKVRPPYRTRHLTENPLIDSPLELSPGQSDSITIALPQEDVQNFEGTLLLATDQYSQTIPLVAAATPPRLQIELPDPALNRIDFGAIDPGETVSRIFMIKNLGGTGSTIGMGVLPPFRIAKNQDDNQSITFSVGPESSAVFTVDFVAPLEQYGIYSDSLEIGTDAGSYSISLAALVQDPNPLSGRTPLHPRIIKEIEDAKKNPPTANEKIRNSPLPPLPPLPPLQDPEKDDNLHSPTGFYTRDFIARNYSDSIPAPSDFQLQKVGRNELTLKWKTPSPDYTVFEIEMREMLLNQKNFRIDSVWVPFHKVDYHRSKGMIYATVKKLNPASIYEFRALTVGDSGKFSQPSKPFVVQTAHPPDYRRAKWLFLFSILFTAGLLLWRYWEKHDGSFPMPTYWPRHIQWPFE